MFIDTHCHLYPEYDFVKLSPEKIVENSINAGVTQMWLASTEKKDIEWNLEFCKKYPKNLKTWVGWHPEQYESFDKMFLNSILEKWCSLQKPNVKNQIPNEIANTKYQILDTTYSPIVGIGEVGVDLAVHKKPTLTTQQQVFETQIQIAKKYKLPIAIHCRDAFYETIEVMEKYPDVVFLWHCFNLSKEKTLTLLNKFPKIYCAFNSIFTYKSGEYLKESIKLIPKTQLVLETDAPFLAPRPFIYEFNTPEGVTAVYRAVSDSLKIPLDKLSALVEENVIKLLIPND